MSGLVRTPLDYDLLLACIRHNTGPLAIDTETTGLHPYTVDEIRGISVAGREWEFYLPISHPESRNFDPQPLLLALRGRQLIFHHGVFDWAFLDQAGMSIDWPVTTVWDTQVVNWLMDENLKIGLKESCERIFGIDAGDEKRHLKSLKGYTWGTYTAEQIGDYAAKDARLTYDLWKWQKQAIGAVQPGISLTTIKREMETQRNLYRMIRTGIAVDPERILQGEQAFMDRVHRIEQMFQDAEVNPNSPKQVANWLFRDGWESTVKTKTGARSVARNVLEDLAGRGHPAASTLLEYRHLAKAVTGYFRPMLSQIGEDGRIHPHFSSVRTVTGRFSCSSPNLQTIPRDDTMPEVRRCFVPEQGWELWGYDLKQAELRVIAGYAGETSMIEALEQGRDLHSETAASIFGDDFTPLQRRLAKNLNFGFAYGIGPAKFATYFAPVPTPYDVEQARQILAGYKRTYPKVAALLTGMERIAKRDGYVPNYPPGRYRRFRGPGYINEAYTAVNFIVQGGIGEFMKDMMNEWYARHEIPSCRRLVLQVHDELVFEIKHRSGANPDVVREVLQGIADRINPFKMRMEWEMKRWA